MSTTALPQSAALRRTTTVDSSLSSPGASASNSPFDSPQRSPSSTSVSSLSSADDAATINNSKSPTQDQLRDTYGNEFELPDFTIKQIRDAIPPHCFQRSGLTGLSYVARDILLLSTTFYLFNTYCTPDYVSSYGLRCALWGVYTFLQGLFATGLWVLAHEAGHQSFSTSKTLNDTVGWVLHSALLVPYFSWKISHGKHHKATGHIERDMVFVPKTREEFSSKLGKLAHEVGELMEETPIATVIHLIIQQLGGWPAYLIVNVTGHDFHSKQTEGKGANARNGWGGGVNHFIPSSPLYERKDEKLILLSDLGLLVVGTVLYALTQAYGIRNMAVWYFLPYLWVNHWLVAITYLQHTDPSLPHYTPESWNFVRGAAATIDRDFWPIGPYFFHGIIETHVLHHYISTIPFYHADEATDAVKKVMGRHYRSDTEGGALGFLGSLWKSTRWCQWVENRNGVTKVEKTEGGQRDERDGVLFFRNTNGLGQKPYKLQAQE